MTVPSLSTRREDVALIVVHLLREILRIDPKVGGRWSRGGLKVTTRLMAALISHPYRTNVRELSSLLWRAIGAQRGELDLFPGYAELTRTPEPVGEGPVDPSRLSREAVQACLDRNGGQQELAWRELGLSSRHALARLVKKYGLAVRRRG